MYREGKRWQVSLPFGFLFAYFVEGRVKSLVRLGFGDGELFPWEECRKSY
jgi:hypothetical protein